MAVISEELGYLFIMAPRTGCTALSVHLVQHLSGRWCPEQDVVDDAGDVVAERKHTTLRQLRGNGVLNGDDVAGLLVFTAVRNPFDSLVSLHTKMTKQYLPLLEDPDAFIHRKPEMLDDIHYLADHTFSDWVVRKYGNLPADPARHLYGGFLAGADRIMRFERLQQDFDDVMRELGVTEDTTIPVLNVTEGRPEGYREMYSRAARRAVERAFDADLERFGYAF